MPDTSARAPVQLADLSLRERERGLVIGGTGSGKSTLADQLGADFDRRYARRGGRRLIIDSKPRYRAEWTVRGKPAAPRYKSWGHGPVLPGAVVVDEPEQLDMAWKMGARVVVVQGESADPGDLARMVRTARLFYRQANANRPQLLQVDEGLDFYHGNGAPKGGDDVFSQTARAGRERGLGLLFGSQRTKGIPAVLMSELTKLWAFRLDNVGDAKRYQEMGAPAFANPTREHTFLYWTKQDYPRVWGPYTLSL